MKHQGLFEIGELVEHRHYDYRGVIVAFDEECAADDAWYERNRTQPPRDQRWYHVLVHGSTHSTYVAESNLRQDEGREQVVHPLCSRLFEYFQSGRYTPKDDAQFPDLWRTPQE